MKKSVAVVGNGFVGGSLTTVLDERGIDVYAYDKAGKYVKEAKSSFGDICAGFPNSIEELILDNEDGATPGFSNIYFVCVPTPMILETGECDTSIVESVLEELARVPGERIAVVKSTVPPGSTEKWNTRHKGDGLHVIFNPEFLREATALEDMRHQTRIILGGEKKSVNKVRDLFRTAFPDVPIHKTSSANAEMVKYITNAFLATKVSFSNEVYEITEKLFNSGIDIDYDRIVELATLDERLGKSHWKVPGPMPADDGSGKLLRGYSGSCFCKDVNSLIFLAKQLGIDPKVLLGGWNKNVEIRPERDWLNLVGRAVSKKK